MADKMVTVEWIFNPGLEDSYYTFGSITAAEVAVLQHSSHITIAGKTWTIGSHIIQNWDANGLTRVVVPLYDRM